MESAFTWTGGAQGGGDLTRRHLTDRVRIVPEADADAYDVLVSDGAVERAVDVRGVWLVLEVETSAPAGLSGAAGGEGRSMRGVWLDLLAGQEIRYRPDADDAAVEIAVVPDVSHTPTLYAARYGQLLPGAVLRLRSKQLLDPGAQVLRDLAARSPYA